MPISDFIQHVITNGLHPVIDDLMENNREIDENNFSRMISGITSIKDDSLALDSYNAILSVLNNISTCLSARDEFKSLHSDAKIIENIIIQLPIKLRSEFIKDEKNHELSEMYDFVMKEKGTALSILQEKKESLSALTTKISKKYQYLKDDVLSAFQSDNAKQPLYTFSLKDLSIADAVIFKKYYAAHELATDICSMSDTYKNIFYISSKQKTAFQTNITIDDTHRLIGYSDAQQRLIQTANALGYQNYKKEKKEKEEVELIQKELDKLPNFNTENKEAVSNEPHEEKSPTFNILEKETTIPSENSSKTKASDIIYNGPGLDLMADVRKTANKISTTENIHSDENKKSGMELLKFAPRVARLMKHCEHYPQNDHNMSVVIDFSIDYLHAIKLMVYKRIVNNDDALNAVAYSSQKDLPSLLQRSATFFKEHAPESKNAGYVYPHLIVSIADQYPHQKPEAFTPSERAKAWMNDKQYGELEARAQSGSAPDKAELAACEYKIKEERKVYDKRSKRIRMMLTSESQDKINNALLSLSSKKRQYSDCIGRLLNDGLQELNSFVIDTIATLKEKEIFPDDLAIKKKISHTRRLKYNNGVDRVMAEKKKHNNIEAKAKKININNVEEMMKFKRELHLKDSLYERSDICIIPHVTLSTNDTGCVLMKTKSIKRSDSDLPISTTDIPSDKKPSIQHNEKMKKSDIPVPLLT